MFYVILTTLCVNKRYIYIKQIISVIGVDRDFSRFHDNHCSYNNQLL